MKLWYTDTNSFKLKFDGYKHCLESTQLESKLNKLEKKIDVDST